MHGDIGDTALVAKLFAEQKIEAVINFAAESHVDRSIDSPEPFIQTNGVGTLRLLDCAKQYWTKLAEPKKSAFASSTSPPTKPTARSSLVPPPSPRTTSRTRPTASPKPPATTSSAPTSTHGLPTLTTNCSNNYGPFHFPEKLIPLVILNVLEGKSLPVYGDGMQIRDWLYVENHAAAIWTVLLGGRIGETYNIGGWNEKPNIEIVNTIDVTSNF